MKIRITHILAVLLVAVVGMTVTESCRRAKAGNADSIIREKVASTPVPSKFSDSTTLVGCSYADKILTLRIELSQEAMARVNADTLQAALLKRIRSGSLDPQLVKSLIAEKGTIRCIYLAGTDSLMFSFTSDQMK